MEEVESLRNLAIENERVEGGVRTKDIFKKSATNRPLVTIITVAYNAEKYIDQTIRSVLKQTYENIEYIIIDGSSTDATLDIIKKYEDKIDYWVSEKDDGIYDAMNKGIKFSRGDIIGILNADDWYEKNAVEEVVNVFKKRNVALVHGAMNRWSASGELISTYGTKEKFDDLYMAPFNHPTCFFDRTVYETIGLFDRQFETAADYDFMLRFKQFEYESYYIDKAFTNFRLVGVTSEIEGAPLVQIWKLLRKNNYSFTKCCRAILYRVFRLFFVKVTSLLCLNKFRVFLRKYLSYHK